MRGCCTLQFNEKNGLNKLKLRILVFIAGNLKFWRENLTSQGVFDIVGFLVILPVFIQLVNLTRHIPLFFSIKSLKKIRFINLLSKKIKGVIFSFYFEKFQMVKKSSLKAKNLQSFEFTKGGLIAKRFFTSFQTSNMPNYYPEHYPTKKKDSNLAPFFEI